MNSLVKFDKLMKKSPYFWSEDRKFYKFIKIIDDNHFEAYCFGKSHCLNWSEAIFNSVETLSIEDFLKGTKLFHRTIDHVSKKWGEKLKDDFLHREGPKYFFYKEVPYKTVYIVYYYGKEDLPICESILAFNEIVRKEERIYAKDINRKNIKFAFPLEIIIDLVSRSKYNCGRSFL